MIKKGTITINHYHKDDAAKRHPVLNDGNGNGYIMTSKQYPQSNANTFEMDQIDAHDFAVVGKVYISNRKIKNDTGKEIGRLKKRSYNNFIQWLLISGTMLTLIILITIKLN